MNSYGYMVNSYMVIWLIAIVFFINIHMFILDGELAMVNSRDPWLIRWLMAPWLMIMNGSESIAI